MIKHVKFFAFVSRAGETAVEPYHEDYINDLFKKTDN